jgi:hypothetical protein
VLNREDNMIESSKKCYAARSRARSVSAKALLPVEAAEVEKNLAKIAGVPVTFSVLTISGLITRPTGYTTVQRSVEERFTQRMASVGGNT